ncbi:MAG: hypothetical protein ACLQDQ_18610 [Myxococcaceae bacterium]
MSSSQRLAALTYKSAFAIYCLLFCGLALRFALLGEVLAPSRQYVETGAIDTGTPNDRIENQKFVDYTTSYIPEIYQHLRGPRSGWLTLWTANNELGRPASQLFGFSRAYPPSWVLSQFTNNPWIFLTILSLGTCFLAGSFMLLYLKELGLAGFAGLLAATSLATSPFFMYWLTFPMFSAVFCWSAGALWALKRLAREPDLLGWSALAFSAYSLLMTGYQQLVVYHFYILSAYALCLALSRARVRSLGAAQYLLLVTSAGVAGATLAMPVYADLVQLYRDSTRIAADISFFTAVLPPVGTLLEASRVFVLSMAPELLGNPVTPTYPLTYDGISVTPLVVFFCVTGLVMAPKKTWGWWTAVLLLCLLGFGKPFYMVGVKVLGLNLSPTVPLCNAGLPLTIIVGYGADALVRRSGSGRVRRAVWLAAGTALAVLVSAVWICLSQSLQVHWAILVAMLTMLVLLVAQQDDTRPALLLLSLFIGLIAVSDPLILRQKFSEIQRTSAFVDDVRAALPADSRLAVAAPGVLVLPANFNAEVGLASLHTYDSLSSKRYQNLIAALGGRVEPYGRRNRFIAPDYTSASFWMANVGLMLSPAMLADQNLDYLGESAGTFLYQTRALMGESIQVIPKEPRLRSDGLEIGDPRLLARTSPSKLSDEGDRLEYQVVPEEPSLLVVSQTFHRAWRAVALAGAGWVPAQTVAVNGVFQGVLLPKDSRQVRLTFEPYSRYAWIAHVFWGWLAVLLGAQAWRASSRRRLQGWRGT